MAFCLPLMLINLTLCWAWLCFVAPLVFGVGRGVAAPDGEGQLKGPPLPTVVEEAPPDEHSFEKVERPRSRLSVISALGFEASEKVEKPTRSRLISEMSVAGSEAGERVSRSRSRLMSELSVAGSEAAEKVARSRSRLSVISVADSEAAKKVERPTRSSFISVTSVTGSEANKSNDSRMARLRRRSSCMQPGLVEEQLKVEDILKNQLQDLGRLTLKEATMATTFLVLVLAWFFQKPGFVTGWADLVEDAYGDEGQLGVEAATPAILMVLLVFALPGEHPLKTPKSGATVQGLVTWHDIQTGIEWGVVLMLGGGFALSSGLKTTGESNKDTRSMASSASLRCGVHGLCLDLQGCPAGWLTSWGGWNPWTFG